MAGTDTADNNISEENFVPTLAPFYLKLQAEYLKSASRIQATVEEMEIL
jgi:hypothetical protein